MISDVQLQLGNWLGLYGGNFTGLPSVEIKCSVKFALPGMFWTNCLWFSKEFMKSESQQLGSLYAPTT